jgi:nucleotide-binding universal stress UspA family protein
VKASAAVLENAGSASPSTKILLAIDESPCSAAAVEAVLKQFPPQLSEVRVLHVDEWPKGHADVSGLRRRSRRREPHRLDAQRAMALRRGTGFACRRPTDSREIPCKDRDAPRRRASRILDFAADWRPDVIGLGSHGRRGVDRFLLGSVSEGVVRHANCSVEVMRGAPTTASD